MDYQQKRLHIYTPREACAWLKTHSYRNIIFDLDDTLYLRSEPYSKAYDRIFAARRTDGWPDGRTLYAGSRDIGEEEYRRYIAGETTLREMQILRTQRSFARYGIALTAQEAAAFEQAYQAAQSEITLVDAFKDLLEDLAVHSPDTFIGLMTNGEHQRQWRKIRALNLQQWIPEEHIYISGDFGADKPDVRAFRCYEQQTGIDGTSTILIGDSPEADIAGAQAAGWQALLVRAGIQGER